MSPTEDPPKDEEAAVFLVSGTIAEPGSGCHQPRPLGIVGLVQGECVGGLMQLCITMAGQLLLVLGKVGMLQDMGWGMFGLYCQAPAKQGGGSVVVALQA